MILSDSDLKLIEKIQQQQLAPKRKGLISRDTAKEILLFMRVKPLERESMQSLCDRIGLSKTKVYTVIKDYKAEGIEYESIPNGFKGVYQRRRYKYSDSVDNRREQGNRA